MWQRGVAYPTSHAHEDDPSGRPTHRSGRPGGGCAGDHHLGLARGVSGTSPGAGCRALGGAGSGDQERVRFDDQPRAAHAAHLHRRVRRHPARRLAGLAKRGGLRVLGDRLQPNPASGRAGGGSAGDPPPGGGACAPRAVRGRPLVPGASSEQLHLPAGGRKRSRGSHPRRGTHLRRPSPRAASDAQSVGERPQVRRGPDPRGRGPRRRSVPGGGLRQRPRRARQPRRADLRGFRASVEG